MPENPPALTLEAATGLGINPIHEFGSEAHKQQWLPDLLAGRAFGDRPGRVIDAAVDGFAAGLGAVTNLSDGYPWGLWIAFDVVTGTALGCGGYAIALLVYVVNRGQYHSLVRHALLTSAVGYTAAILALGIDVGAPWNFWKVPLWTWAWNTDSVLLEVALCVMAYIVVLWIEMAPVFLERWQRESDLEFEIVSGTLARARRARRCWSSSASACRRWCSRTSPRSSS